MTDYRELLRLQSLGFNNSQIAASTGIARQTVITTLRRATMQGLTWQTVKRLSGRELTRVLFPPTNDKGAQMMPDFEWIHREMTKPCVTLQLLWFEYSDKCRETGEVPYQLSQFKKHYLDYTLKNKATAEGVVGFVSTYILAELRNQRFFSLKELNDTIREQLHNFNHKSFQKKDSSRAIMFADERKANHYL